MEAPSTGSPHDPIRQQFLRHLHSYLGQITNEMIRESGENYDRKKRDDKFHNSLRCLADYVVEFNRKQEQTRESASAPRVDTTGDYASLRSTTSTSLSNTLKPTIVAPHSTSSEMASLSHASSLPRTRSFSEAQIIPGSTTRAAPAAISRPSVSPTSALEASFSSMSSLQSSRVQSSESVPTVGGMSAPRSPAITNTTHNTNSQSGQNSSNNTSPVQQAKPSSNFGFVAPQKKIKTLSSLQKAAISTTAEIEASLATVTDFIDPQRDATLHNKQASVSMKQSQIPQQTSSSSGALNNELSDSLASLGRKRKRQKKQWCHLCNDHKEGFRGPHELARHMNIQHQTKKTVFIVYDDSPEGNMFKDCKHCSRRKIYGQDYNAACHLRRAHFNKRLKTDTPEEREFKQMHPDFPPMEELRPWLRKCLVDVSKLRDTKYVDNQDEAILKVEPAAARHEELCSSDKDLDQEMTDEEQPLDGPATPPPESEAEPDAEQPTKSISQDAPANDSMLHNNFMDFDFSDFSFDSAALLENNMQPPEFIFNAPPLPQQPSTIPRTNNTPAIFTFQMQHMGLDPSQIITDKFPAFVGLGLANSSFAPTFDFNGNSVESTDIKQS
ncbi:hypothetical protein TWF694_003118 [Orbilia ellipsospora]|uniref:DUF7896 domain-containing protein n=1 Tax=Orbilia ellipsospora TaxID=2528407 RepID=A0AAV9X0N7_9PEZI